MSLPIRRLIGLAERCVFGKQSLDPIHCGRFGLGSRGPSPTCGTPSSEVTGLFCLVPSARLTRAPEDIHPTYLCRFTVQAPERLATRFFLAACLGPVGSPCGSFPHRLSGFTAPGFAWEPPYGLRPAQPIAGWSFTSASPLRVLIASPVVQEC